MTLSLFLTEKQLYQLNGKVMDLGNLGFGGMVISQLFPGVDFSLLIALIGFVFLVVCYASAYQLMRKVS